MEDLIWQIERALGLNYEKQAMLGDADEQEKYIKEAETYYLKALKRTSKYWRGRTSSVLNPSKDVPFDDLLRLRLGQGQMKQAFWVAQEAELVQMRWLQQEATQKKMGKISKHLKPKRLKSSASRNMAKDEAILFFRAAYDSLNIFVVKNGGIEVARIEKPRREIEKLIYDYNQRKQSKSSLLKVRKPLKEIISEPLHKLLKGVNKLVLVLGAPLGQLGFAAIPWSDKHAWVDKFELVRAPTMAAALRYFDGHKKVIKHDRIFAFGQPVPTPSAPYLPLAMRELLVIQEEYPQAKLSHTKDVTETAIKKALRIQSGIVHFAGHVDLAPANLYEPLEGGLRIGQDTLSVLEILATQARSELVVLSSCRSAVGLRSLAQRSEAPDVPSLSTALHLAGVKAVLASPLRVDDVAVALLVKHFYRSMRGQSLASALKIAQKRVRKRYPHPAWWSSMVLSVDPLAQSSTH